MRVLLVINNLRGGGAEGAFLRYAQVLKEHGHSVQLVLLNDRRDYPLPTEIKVHILRKRPARMGLLGKRLTAMQLARWYRGAISEGPFDLVVSTLPFADEVVRLARLPRACHRIANTLSAEIECAAETRPRGAARLAQRYRSIYSGQTLIAVSAGVAADLRKTIGPSVEIHTIYNPFGFENIRVQAACRDPDIPAEPFLLHVGRFTRQKRHDLLLDAYVASGLPHKLVLMTKPHPDLDALIAARNLEARVAVIGFRSNPFSWFRNASAVILCSDYEGLPNVLIEALACGTPVVSTDCPSGPREVLTGSLASWLVPCGDATALAAAMRRVVEYPPDVSGVLKERFSEERFVGAIEKLAADRRA